jgi:hypothetical protein
MIGRPYDAELWNCATLVAERIGFHHAPGAEWGRAFTAALRRNGEPLRAPRHGCVVVITNPDNSLHVGIVEGASVLHSDKTAGTCRTPLAILRREAKRVRFYAWRG